MPFCVVSSVFCSVCNLFCGGGGGGGGSGGPRGGSSNTTNTTNNTTSNSFDTTTNVNNQAAMSGLTGTFEPKGKSSGQTALVDQPTFTDTVNPLASVLPATMAAPTAVNAKRGGLIGHYDVGGGIPDVSLRPTFAQGKPQLTSGFSKNIPHPQTGTIAFQAHKAGGGIHEHRPEFFSEGGLNHTFVQGDGDGTSDSVPAMLANGEFVLPADVVSSLGNGDNKSGAKVMDEFLKTVRSHKRDAAPGKLPPDSKGPLGYLLEAKKKVK
jgi:hypothetical protein